MLLNVMRIIYLMLWATLVGVTDELHTCMLVNFLSATNKPVGRLHAEDDGTAVQSTHNLSWPVH